MPTKSLKELETELINTQSRVHKVYEQAAVDRDGEKELDFSHVDVYGEELKGDTYRIAEKVREDDTAMNKLVDQINSIKGAEEAVKRAMAEPAKDMKHASPDDDLSTKGRQQNEYKTLGQMIMSLPEFKAGMNLGHLISSKGSKGLVLDDFSIKQLKTLFQTSAGWAPESVRTGRVVPAVTRPLQLLDIIPMGTTGQAADVYMEETTRTHSAAETDEGGTYAESEFVLTEQSKTVRKITDSVPVTDEQLEDVAGAESYLEDRIRFGIRQRLDYQMLNGNDIAPNLGGILNNGSIQTQAKGADPIPDAFYKAMVDIMLTGRAMPTNHVMHPQNWQTVRLLRTVDGVYIWGNPSEAGPERMWGLPVAMADSISLGTGLVGSFETAWIQLKERRGLILEMGYVGNQFKEGKKTIRASMRAVLVIYRAPAFCEVTGL